MALGIMDLRAMAVVTAAITAERLAPAGERVARALGAAAIGAGLFLIVRAAGLGRSALESTTALPKGVLRVPAVVAVPSNDLDGTFV